MDSALLHLIYFTVIIHMIDTLAYSVRLNSVKSGHYALSLSLFNIFYLVSLTAHSLQAPLIGSIIDTSISSTIDPLPAMRLVILAASAGTLLGIVATPTFLKIFASGVNQLEKTGSVTYVVIEALHIKNLRQIFKYVTRPTRKMLYQLPIRKMPKELLLLNSLVTAIYTIGVLSAYYAALLVSPEHRLSAAASAGVINSAANIIMMFFIDPKSALITDQAFKGRRPYIEVKALVVLLMSSKLMGTILGQIFLIPLAQTIKAFY